eukprot:gene33234-40208_t
MEAHEGLLRFLVKLPVRHLLPFLWDFSPKSPFSAVTSLWEEYMLIAGERRIANRIFIKCPLYPQFECVGWVMEENFSFCVLCATEFSIMNSRSHCRACGNLICQHCKRRAYIEDLESLGKMTVCTQCSWGQATVRIYGSYNSYSGQPLIVRDLPPSESYRGCKATPRFVIHATPSSPQSEVKDSNGERDQSTGLSISREKTESTSCGIKVILSTSPLIPTRDDVSFTFMCGGRRGRIAEAEVYDIVVHPDVLTIPTTTSGAVASVSKHAPSLTMDSISSLIPTALTPPPSPNVMNNKHSKHSHSHSNSHTSNTTQKSFHLPPKVLTDIISFMDRYFCHFSLLLPPRIEPFQSSVPPPPSLLPTLRISTSRDLRKDKSRKLAFGRNKLASNGMNTAEDVVMTLIPPKDLFEKYIQIPFLDLDADEIEFVPCVSPEAEICKTSVAASHLDQTQ